MVDTCSYMVSETGVSIDKQVHYTECFFESFYKQMARSKIQAEIALLARSKIQAETALLHICNL